jgi:hypothetical protein
MKLKRTILLFRMPAGSINGTSKMAQEKWEFEVLL